MSISLTGGPAFPSTDTTGDVSEHAAGMSLRDYFAAAALSALIADSEPRREAAYKQGKQLIAWLAELAYSAADAMLAERRKLKKGISK